MTAPKTTSHASVTMPVTRPAEKRGALEELWWVECVSATKGSPLQKRFCDKAPARGAAWGNVFL